MLSWCHINYWIHCCSEVQTDTENVFVRCKCAMLHAENKAGKSERELNMGTTWWLIMGTKLKWHI